MIDKTVPRGTAIILSQKAIEKNLHASSQAKKRGRLIRWTKNMEFIIVMREGNVTTSRYSPDFWDVDTSAEKGKEEA